MTVEGGRSRGVTLAGWYTLAMSGLFCLLMCVALVLMLYDKNLPRDPYYGDLLRNRSATVVFYFAILVSAGFCLGGYGLLRLRKAGYLATLLPQAIWTALVANGYLENFRRHENAPLIILFQIALILVSVAIIGFLLTRSVRAQFFGATSDRGRLGRDRTAKVIALTTCTLAAITVVVFFAVTHRGEAGTLEDAKRLSAQVGDLMEQQRYEEAIPLAERVVAIREKFVRPECGDYDTSRLIALYRLRGMFMVAEPLLKRSLTVCEKSGGSRNRDTLSMLNSLGMLYVDMGAYTKGLPLLQRALATRETVLGPMDPDTAESLNDLGGAYLYMGMYSKAEPLLNRALAIQEKGRALEDPDMTEGSSSLNSAHFSEEGKSLLKEVMAISEKYRALADKDMVPSLNSLGTFYSLTGAHAKAESLLRRAAKILEKSDSSRYPMACSVFSNLGRLLMSEGEYYEAYLFLGRALKIAEGFGPVHPAVEYLLNDLGQLYLDTGDPEKALENFQTTRFAPGIGKYHLARKEYKQACAEFEKTLELTPAAFRAELLITGHIGLGLAREGLRQLPEARASFGKAIGLIEGQWQTLDRGAKSTFLDGALAFGFPRLAAYEGMVRVLLKERSRGWERESLQYAERAKSRLFLEELAGRDLRGRTEASAAALERSRDYQMEIASLRKQAEVLQAQGLKTDAKRMEEALQRKRDEYEAFLEQEQKRDLETASLMTATPFSLEKLQGQLGPETTLLEYYTGQDALYAWVVTADAVRAFELPQKEAGLRVEVDELLLPNRSSRSRKAAPLMGEATGDINRETTAAEREENRRRFLLTAVRLYREIFAPLEGEIRTQRLIVVPHGALHRVPFAALGDGGRVLADRHTISVLPSAGVAEFVVRKRKPVGETMLVLANPTVKEAVPLLFAEPEGREVAALFPKSRALYRDEATETALRREAGGFGVVHIASHGEFHDRQPLQSGLLLARDDKNDGRLEVHELFDLDLQKTALVTLSACETGLGRVKGGDDLVGLSRGLTYAGASSLLVSLWKVDDESTRPLMVRFYKHLRAGKSKPEALRQAQLEVRSMTRYADPYFWAPFVMVGDWL